VTRMASDAPGPRTSANPFEGLRAKALGFRLPEGTARIIDVPDLHGLVVDWSVGSGVATVACMAEGSTSMYLSGGGGIIGAGGHDDVRLASSEVLSEASAARAYLDPATDVPLPTGGRLRFTVILDGGLRSAEVSLEDVKSGHPLFRLVEAFQRVVFVVRNHSR